MLLAIVFISVLAPPRLHGQSLVRSDAPLVFETASVKPNDSRNGRRDVSLAGGRFAMTYSTLHELIVFAFPRPDGRLRSESEIVGEPPWLNVDHFDVVAKPPEGQGVRFDAGNTGAGGSTAADLSAVDRIRMMLQSLLADRFKLSVHHEPRDLAVYELRVDRGDGRLGPQLKRVDVDCAAQRGSDQFCGGFRTVAPGHIVGRGVTLSLLAQFLELPAGRNVFDRSGLHGAFDVELQYAPDRLQLRGPDTPVPDQNAVSVFTALREQLGLKLESARASIDVLVIDRAEKPTSD
jgi:uncharacterized protein (TIGR03435 family)